MDGSCGQLSVQSLLGQNALYSGELRKKQGEGAFAKYTKKYGVIHNGFFYLFDDFTSTNPNTAFSLVDVSFMECPREKNKFDFCLETNDNGSKKNFFAVNTERELLEWITMLSTEKRKYSNFTRTAPDGGSFSNNEFSEDKHSYDSAYLNNNFVEVKPPMVELQTRRRSQTALVETAPKEQKGSRRHSSPACSPSRARKFTLGKLVNFLKPKRSTPECSPQINRRRPIPRLELSMSLDDDAFISPDAPAVDYPPSPVSFYPITYTNQPFYKENTRRGSAPLLDVSPGITRRGSAPVLDVSPNQHPSLQRQKSVQVIRRLPLPRQQSTPELQLPGYVSRSSSLGIPTEYRAIPTPPRSPACNRPSVSPGSSRRHSTALTASRSLEVPDFHSVPTSTQMLEKRFNNFHVRDNISGDYSNHFNHDGTNLSPSPNTHRQFNWDIPMDDHRKTPCPPARKTSGGGSGFPRVYEAVNELVEAEDPYVQMHASGYLAEQSTHSTMEKENIYVTSSQTKNDVDEDIYVVPETKRNLHENECLPASVYQWSMDRVAANQLLSDIGTSGLYVIRTAKDEKKVLSVFVLGETRHYKIFQENSQMFLRRDHPTFPNICDLIRYYKNYDLPTCAARLQQPYR